MVTHGGTLHGWLRIGGSGGLLFVAYTLCRVSGFDDDDDNGDNFFSFFFFLKLRNGEGDIHLVTGKL